jgi:NAD(P)H-hydrate repair Nnr-like enzyme with NAD(P)H-hydrate epimerase domain
MVAGRQGAGDQGGAVGEERRVGVAGGAGKQGGDGRGGRRFLAERLEVHDVLAVGLEREGATSGEKMAEESGG